MIPFHFLRHFYQFFLDTGQFYANIVGRDADYCSNFIVADAFEPKQDKASVDKVEARNAVVEDADLLSLRIVGLVGVDVHCQRNGLGTTALLLVLIDGCVERHAVNPRLCAATAFVLVEAVPKPDKDFLEQVVDFVLVGRKHIAHRVDGSLVLPYQKFKLMFFVVVHDSFNLFVFVATFIMLDNKGSGFITGNLYFFALFLFLHQFGCFLYGFKIGFFHWRKGVVLVFAVFGSRLFHCLSVADFSCTFK